MTSAEHEERSRLDPCQQSIRENLQAVGSRLDPFAIIRDATADTLIIQGVAGSGKTSIALHRISILLYRFKDMLSSEDILIISPNRVVADYIGNDPAFALGAAFPVGTSRHEVQCDLLEPFCGARSGVHARGALRHDRTGGADVLVALGGDGFMLSLMHKAHESEKCRNSRSSG